MTNADSLTIKNAGAAGSGEGQQTFARLDLAARIVAPAEYKGDQPSLPLAEESSHPAHHPLDHDHPEMDAPPCTSPQAIIEQLLQSLPDRERYIIELRYGLNGHEAHKFETLGRMMNCSHERVRQLKERALGRLRSPTNQELLQPLVTRVRQAVEEAHGVIAISAVSEALGNNQDISEEYATNIVLFLLSFIPNIIMSRRLPILVMIDSPSILSLEDAHDACCILRRLLFESLAPIPIRDVLSRFAQDRKGQQIYRQVSEAFLVACLKAHPDIAVSAEGMCSLKKWANRRSTDIIFVLRQHGKPMHYSEIARQVNLRLPPGQQTTAHNLHALMGRQGSLFVRVGHGIFGLAEWGLKRDKNLSGAAYRVLCEAGHALPIEQLIDRVLETWQAKRSSVRAAIDLDDRFERVGRSLYWIKDASPDS